ncbi:ACP S-malonyltransferase [Streptomyces sp. GS7]|uniref:ACP S-malonyltransferase n=1 Tax=Streptomyces sp. GS7 TaxID=2692234 RepID=UPI0013183AEE|nr:ACP S-malonyltransferase [Streptomyces sp. GS7]QHC22572.1 ACP S-malonyltransferase [Streptomyces sp. GS7]
MSYVLMFPGQGAQRPGMGAEWFDRFPELTEAADEILGYSLRDLCVDDPDGLLGRTEYTQPAVYTVNALGWRVMREADGEPDLAIGHSLGEYNALEAAGVFGFADGLRLVAARARAMSAVTGGGMAAVVGLDDAVLRLVLRRSGLTGVEAANFNTADQTVIAGPVDELAEAGGALRAAGARAVRPLDVSGPFHTSHMAPAAAEFAPELAAAELAAPAFPVVANRTARPYRAGGIAGVLLEQIDHPVLWRHTVEGLLSEGRTRFQEAGGSTVLTRMLRALRRELASV